MNVELSERAARMAKDLVHDGRFASVEDALEYGLMAIEQLDAEAEALLGDESDEWWAEVNVMIQEGAADIEAGRTVEATPEWWDGIADRGRERLRTKLNRRA
jgi:Arc/MetJ-type ribon-helix-helix transcriptional regulator